MDWMQKKWKIVFNVLWHNLFVISECSKFLWLKAINFVCHCISTRTNKSCCSLMVIFCLIWGVKNVVFWHFKKCKRYRQQMIMFIQQTEIPFIFQSLEFLSIYSYCSNIWKRISKKFLIIPYSKINPNRLFYSI